MGHRGMIDIQLHDQLIHGYGGPTDGGWEFVMAICYLSLRGISSFLFHGSP